MLLISELYEDRAIANEIDKRNWQSVNHIPGIHDNGPRDHGVWRLTLTVYYSNKMVIIIILNDADNVYSLKKFKGIV